MVRPTATEALIVFVDAHEIPHPNTGHREPILFIQTMGGGGIQHHGIPQESTPEVDEALIEEMHSDGTISIDYNSGGSLSITPTALGRQLAKEHKRVTGSDSSGNFDGVLAAIAEQHTAAAKLAWPAVRPFLSALRDHWEAEGLSPHGISLIALFKVTPDEHDDLALATLRALLADGYLRPTSAMAWGDPPMPAEVQFTDRSRQALDGWPGADPPDLVANLLAVLAEEAAAEPDDARKRRLLRVAETVRELGVDIAGNVLSQVITGS